MPTGIKYNRNNYCCYYYDPIGRINDLLIIIYLIVAKQYYYVKQRDIRSIRIII